MAADVVVAEGEVCPVPGRGLAAAARWVVIAAGAVLIVGSFLPLFTSDLGSPYRNDLGEPLVDRLLEQDLTTGDRIVGLFDDFVRATGNVPGYLQAVTGELERDLASPQISAERTDRFDQEILRLLTPGIESGEVRTDYPPQFLARMVAAVYVSTIRYWRQDPAYDLAEGFRMAGSYVAESLATRA